MNQVEIFYNPYRSLSRIVVGATPVAEHDELAKYRQEPFHIWCDKIFDLLSREINDTYELSFHSTFIECEIIKMLAGQAPDCAAIRTGGCIVNLPLQKRFDAFLNTQKDTARYTINATLPSGNQQLLTALTAGLPAKGGGIYEMKTSYSHCGISLRAGGISQLVPDANTLNVWLSTNNGDWMRIPAGQPGGPPILFVCADDRVPTGFREKQGDIYCYSCETAKLQKLLLRFLEFACMAPDFQRRFHALRTTPGYTAETLTLEALDSIDPVVRVTAPNTLEVGRQQPLSIDVFPKGAACPELVYQTVPDGIVLCENGSIRALAQGCVQVTVYPKGGVEPCSTFAVSTNARNRIVQMKFCEPSLILPQGEVRQLELDFMPQDADNTAAIRWKSTDPNLVKVKQDGRIKAIAPGNCRIIADAEGVSAACTVAVQPVVEKIVLSEEQLRIHIGESAELKYNFSPKNAFDPQIQVRIADPTIVSYQNGRVLPRCIGKTNIIFESAHGTGQAVCQVEVDSSFHAKQRGVSLVAVAAVLCVLSFLLSGLLGTLLAAGGAVCVLLGFLRSKKTITLFMILVFVACLGSAGYSLMQLLT